MNSSTTGVLYALGGFGIWGLFPIYFKTLGHVPALEVLAHRIVWSVVLLVLLLWLKGWSHWTVEWRDRRQLAYYLATTLLIGGNWLVYIWAVQHDRILQASLGYYINPLVNVLLGVLFLRERLSVRQQWAVAVAALGVMGMVARHGAIPWVSLFLACSFALYGLLHKKASLSPLPSLFLETLLMLPPALGLLVVLALQGDGALGMVDRRTDLLLLLAGVATVVPLVWFLEATQRLRLATVGLMFYLTPTLQFLQAVGLYHEPFTAVHGFTFACVWITLAIYSVDAIIALRAFDPQRAPQ